MISFSVLASGSRANCVYAATSRVRVLVDCGLSAKQIEHRLGEISVCAKTITAVVVSHEHTDHVAGIRVFAQRYGVEVYVNRQTFAAAHEIQAIAGDRIRFFESGVPFVIEDLQFDPFSVSHDAVDPVAFRVCSQQMALGIVTDLGQVTELVRDRTRGLDAVVIESNHCPVLLEESAYPWSLKQRISGRTGHLCNAVAGELLEQMISTERPLQIAVAAHISENSNRPELALESLRGGWKRAGNGIEPVFVAATPLRPTVLYQLG